MGLSSELKKKAFLRPTNSNKNNNQNTKTGDNNEQRKQDKRKKEESMKGKTNEYQRLDIQLGAYCKIISELIWAGLSNSKCYKTAFKEQGEILKKLKKADFRFQIEKGKKKLNLTEEKK